MNDTINEFEDEQICEYDSYEYDSYNEEYDINDYVVDDYVVDNVLKKEMTLDEMISTLNKSQTKGLKDLRSGKNICLMGEAGTGKTHLLNIYIRESKEQHKNIIMMAPTGIAALKINGVTMHNACSIPIPAYGHYAFEIKESQIKPLLEADIIMIDEISMCRNDVFEYFSYVIDAVMKYRKENASDRKLQIIVSGDFFQLPPVVKTDELNAFRRLALDPSGYCFTTPAWKKFKFKNVILTDVVRQDDMELVENLNKLRHGDASCLPYFNKRVFSKEQIEEICETNKNIMFICSTNAEAALINDNELAKIDGPRCLYQARREKCCGKDYSVDENLVLKNGAKIMFMANDISKDEYRNGQLGTVVECKEESVMVELDTGKIIEVKRYRWPTNKITLTNGITTKKEIGAYYQLPIKLAYATTMHKTQGQTYEGAIISPNSFADGQLYVATSRVTNIDGLIFTEEILPEYVKVSQLVAKFYDGDYEVPETRIKKKKELETKALKKHNEKKKRKTSTKKSTTAKKTTTKKSTANKTTTRKTSTTAKKSTAKKTTTRKTSTTKKSTTKKPIAKKPTTKKTTTRKSSTTGRTSTAKKTSTTKRTSTAKKTTSKRTTSKE